MVLVAVSLIMCDGKPEKIFSFLVTVKKVYLVIASYSLKVGVPCLQKSEAAAVKGSSKNLETRSEGCSFPSSQEKIKHAIGFNSRHFSKQSIV